MQNKKIIKVKTKPKENVKKYPSAEFVYSACLEDYNHVLANYDRIYDRINIVLTLCGVILIFFITNFDITALYKWENYSCGEKVLAIAYVLLAGISLVFIAISVIKLLLLSRSEGLLTFDSNSIIDESLYYESTEDAALWITLQYTKCINNVREKTIEKQRSFSRAIIFVIISIVAYIVSTIIKNGGKL